MNSLLRFCVVFAVLAIIPSLADRSPYVPRPLDYPGLLPRFGEENNSSPSTSTTTTQRTQPTRPQSTGETDDNLGNRLGETVPPRAPARLPCVECYVYITRSGEMLRVNREDIVQGRRRSN